jgi:hypothetical protein
MARGVIWVGAVLLGWLATGCGQEVARTTGTLRVSLAWSGVWPEEGLVVLALFKVSPWDADFVPGPPAAFRVAPRPEAARLTLAIADPGVAFDRYRSLVLAWQDPAPPEQSMHMLPLSVAGTDLAHLEQAAAIVLTPEAPDLEFDLPDVVLYARADEMRAHYQPVGP